MKLVTFKPRESPSPRVGVLRRDRVVDLAAATGGRLPASLIELIAAGRSAWSIARDVARNVHEGLALADVTLVAPIPNPSKNVFAVGRNYVEHVKEGAAARESEAEIPKVPVFFTKAPTTVVGPGDIPYPTATRELDWEAELAVVIGKGGCDIPAERALEHVFGYTAANDLSARDLQFGHRQWFKGKSLDATCPLGPWVVTGDELGDPQQLDIECRVNGAVKQSSNTSNMIFGIPAIIESLSAGMTLEPGDVILTGTPEGVGYARKPPEFLEPGDVVEVDIPAIGVLRNTITTGAWRGA